MKRNNMVNKTALITGITGQDGAYLAEFLLSKNYTVHGIKRRSSLFNTDRVNHLYQDPHEGDTSFFLHYGDMTDSTNLIRIIQEVQPDEIYNLAAQSHVQVSFETPEYTANTDGLGTLRLLEAIRILEMEKKTRFYQASTSELYGKAQEIPQKETTPFYPRSPYAVAKLYGYWITIQYREAYGIFACNGILFNHESPIRGETFVTRKITRAVARIYYGLQNKIYLGNLDAKRDWGHARDYVEGMWLMLQQDDPDDYVLATGQTHTIRDFVERAFKSAGIIIRWEGKGIEEKGVIADIDSEHVNKVFDNDRLDIDKQKKLQIGSIVVEIDKRYFRPTEVDILLGDATKANNRLGWVPKHSINDIIFDMMHHDMNEAAKELHLINGGYPLQNFHE